MEPGQDVMARPATEAHLRGLPPRHTDVAEVVVSKTFSEALVALEAQLLYNPTAIHVLLTPGRALARDRDATGAATCLRGVGRCGLLGIQFTFYNIVCIITRRGATCRIPGRSAFTTNLVIRSGSLVRAKLRR